LLGNFAFSVWQMVTFTSVFFTYFAFDVFVTYMVINLIWNLIISLFNNIIIYLDMLISYGNFSLLCFVWLILHGSYCTWEIWENAWIHCLKVLENSWRPWKHLKGLWIVNYSPWKWHLITIISYCKLWVCIVWSRISCDDGLSTACHYRIGGTVYIFFIVYRVAVAALSLVIKL